ncbi:MAG: polyprenyl synthetase family protein [Bacteroidetes bacterium]|nr:polyprenyl synthetase family protein [Bacteroidota bacterium]
MKSIATLQELIRKEINQLHFGNRPKELYDPISYIMSLGGKRMRPLLVLLGYQLVKKHPEEIIRPALAVEVFHNFTLMHDDIMDEAPLRRGKPTVHEKWDNTVAILSGDAMLVKAYDLMMDLDPGILPEAIRQFNKCALEVCEGQQIDMNFESLDVVVVEEYLEMIRLKTAVLLGFSLEYGALMGGMKEPERKQLYKIGVNMGMSFQLTDDLLDVYGDQEKFGKQVGGDIISNKKTYLLIKAMELSSGEQRSDLLEWVGKKEFDNKEKVSAVKKIYEELGIKGITSRKINKYFDHAMQLLEDLDVRDEGKQTLRDFASQLMKREN